MNAVHKHTRSHMQRLVILHSHRICETDQKNLYFRKVVFFPPDLQYEQIIIIKNQDARSLSLYRVAREDFGFVCVRVSFYVCLCQWE